MLRYMRIGFTRREFWAACAVTGSGMLQGQGVAAPPAPPYIGVSYYPEVAGDEIDRDIARMREIGINHVRFGEFAWSVMEPAEGRFDFSLHQGAVDKFAKAGIAVVLCTPTAAPPAWLSEKHPEILRVNALGLTVGHGGRRQYCPNSPVYREYSRKIAGEMGRRFGSHPGIIAWQIDNEFWEECFCDRCRSAFHEWLQHRFNTPERLNREWLTVLWSQEYQSFDQVPLPNPNRVGAGHHPSLVRAYREFLSDSYIGFCNEQVTMLRKYTPALIYTNGHNPVYQLIDYECLFRNLDIVATDTYAGPGDLARFAFENDWMRAMGKPFWMAETSSTMSAGTAAPASGDFADQPGSLRAKMWLNYALGADAVSFWLWRNHWAGQELEHGALLYPWGDEQANTGEIRQVGRELAQYGTWLRQTRPRPAEVAMHYGVPSQWIFEATPIVPGFHYDRAITEFHRLLLESGLPRDVITAGAAVDRYRVIFSPYLPSIDDPLLNRMQSFVAKGGTWVLGPLSACRTPEATAHQHAAYGAAFEKWLGVHVRHRLPAAATARITTDSGTVSAHLWCDAYQADSSHRVLARYNGNALDGQPAIIESQIGRGRVLLLGTLPDTAWLRNLIGQIAGAPKVPADDGVVSVERVDSRGNSAGWIAINTEPSPRKLRLPGQDQRELPAYGVAILPAK